MTPNRAQPPSRPNRSSRSGHRGRTVLRSLTPPGEGPAAVLAVAAAVVLLLVMALGVHGQPTTAGGASASGASQPAGPLPEPVAPETGPSTEGVFPASGEETSGETEGQPTDPPAGDSGSSAAAVDGGVDSSSGTAAEPAPDPATLGPVVPLREVEWAGLLWAGPQGYHPAHVVSAEVELRITGFVARARVTQRFANPGEAWMEGVYVFPLPESAAVDRLRLVVGQRVIEGQVREKEEARQVYEQARTEGRKASLVEQHRPNVFTTRVANVGPGEAVEVVIELQQTVRYDAGELSLRFPTVVNPRFTPAPDAPPAVESIDGPVLASAHEPLPPAGGEGSAAAAVRLASSVARRAAAPVTAVAGAVEATLPTAPSAPPVNPVRFRAVLDAGFPLDYLDSPYHRVDVEPLGDDRFRIALADGAVSADRDFELVWAPEVGEEPRATLFTEDHEGDTYALLAVLPPDPRAAGWVPLEREMVFILDVSGSMHGASIEQARRALGAVLDGLRPGDTFNVIAFSNRARALFPGSLEATPEAVETARRWVAGLRADGGTNMLPALAAALEGPPPGYSRTGERTLKQVVFLTDGAVGNEAQLFDYIHRRLGDARLFTIGIGSAPNGHFMRRAAEAGRGTYTFIGDPSEVAFKVERLARKLEGPVLTDLEVRWDDPTAEVWPERLPDLYSGEPLVVAARTLFAGSEVEISGRRDGVLWSHTVPLQATLAQADGGPSPGVRQLWARRKIDAFLDRLVTGADPTEIRRAVVETALEHHLVSRYTSLVAVDVTPSRPAGEGLRGVAVPSAVPAGNLPVGATGWPFALVLGFGLLLFATSASLVVRQALRPARAAEERWSRPAAGRDGLGSDGGEPRVRPAGGRSLAGGLRGGSR